MKLLLAAIAGWALVIATAVDQPAFSWLIGPGSLLATLFPGTQHYMGFEGVEVVWFVGTLPVLALVIRYQRS